METDYKHTYTSRLLFITQQSWTREHFEALWTGGTTFATFSIRVELHSSEKVFDDYYLERTCS
jgi:hypothetical protein